MITCIAIDDEPIALDVMRTHAARVPSIELKQTFLSSLHALNFILETPIDFILLDISMPGLSGLELARQAVGKTIIVFTTAYSEYAVQGFDLAVADYLLKPISFSRFLQACNRVQHQLSVKTAVASEKSLFVKDGYEWTRINIDNLLYIQANDNYLTFYERDRKTVTRMTLGEAQEKLPSESFMRVHKSYIVNFSKLDKIEKHQLTIQQAVIPLSSSYQKAFFNKLG